MAEIPRDIEWFKYDIHQEDLVPETLASSTPLKRPLPDVTTIPDTVSPSAAKRNKVHTMLGKYVPNWKQLKQDATVGITDQKVIYTAPPVTPPTEFVEPNIAEQTGANNVLRRQIDASRVHYSRTRVSGALYAEPRSRKLLQMEMPEHDDCINHPSSETKDTSSPPILGPLSAAIRNSDMYQESLLLLRQKLRLQWHKIRKDYGGTPKTEHIGYVCDRCGVSPIIGVRWVCAECPLDDCQIDLCTRCVDKPFAKKLHNQWHSFAAMSECVDDSPNFEYLNPKYCADD